MFLLSLLLLCGELIFAQNNVANLENKFRLAQSYLQAGSIDKAESIFAELASAQPWNQRYVKALNDVYLSQKKYDISIKLLERSISANKKDIGFYGMLGTTYYILNDKQKAYEIWDEAIKAIDNDQISYKLVANFALENRDFDKAIDYLQQGKALVKDPQIYSLDLARIYTANMKYKDAAMEYCDLLIAQPLQLEAVKRYLVEIISRPGGADEVEEAINQHPLINNSKTLKELLAYVYVANNKYDSAYELMKQIDSDSGNNGFVLYKFAQDLYNEGAFETALSCFESIVQNYSKSEFYSSAEIGYARTFEIITIEKSKSKKHLWKTYSEVDSSIVSMFAAVVNNYKNLSKKYKNTIIAAEADYRAANIYFENKTNLDEAFMLLNNIVATSQFPNYAIDAYKLLGKLSVYKNELTNAYQYYRKAILARGATPEIQRQIKFEQAKLAFWQDDFSSSLNLLTEITQFLQDEITNDALELALLINTNRSDSINLSKYSNALLLAEQNKFEKAYVIMDSLSVNKNLYILSKYAEFKKAELLLAQDKYGIAIEILNKIILEDKSGLYSDKSLFLKGNIYQFALNDFQNASRCYQDILEKYPNSLYFDKSRELIQELNTKADKNI